MTSVIDFATAKAEREPFMTGEAFCTHCKHIWTASSPLGATALECPKCGTMKGVYRHGVMPAGGALFVCKCGNDLFIVQPHRIMCCSCGIVTTWEKLADI